MAEENPSLESRLQLTDQVQALAGRVEQLASKLEHLKLEPGAAIAGSRRFRTTPP